jgi:TonB family protein
VLNAEPSAVTQSNAKILESPTTVEAINKRQLDSTKKDYEAKSKAAPRQQASDVYTFADKNAGLTLSNRFNYRVVDAQNNPVPFANVTNTRDNVGTYTDIRGNFNLISADSTLDVQIRSLGYNSANYKLVPSAKQNELILKEDDQARREVLTQNRKLISSVTRKDSTELEEPEVGWGNYNTYIANNIQIPNNIRAKNTRSDVELSFDIDRAGNPINIKVTKSSQCKACDDEAIRLLKEGPKWKRKGKKSKTTILIAVDQK